MRYLTPFLERDLARKSILLSGPRQVGKSTLAKSLLDQDGVYLNWDVKTHQRLIREIGWPKESSLVVLDELHKLPKWKGFLKGVLDEFQNEPPLLVTGSARLEVLRRTGDALTGRTFQYHLHPIDLHEARFFLPRLNGDKRMERLLKVGGFPEALLHPENAPRLLNDRLDLVVREDLRDFSRTSALRSIELLVELLRERVGGQVSFSHLAEDLSVSFPTVKSWIEHLEKLYLVFLLRPYSRGLSRGLRKEPKIYFYDCAASYDDKGARLENLVACSLLKYCDFCRDAYGRSLRLWYFRDREKREVDFVVTEATRVKWCIEVKAADDSLHSGLLYLHQRLRPEASFQLVKDLIHRREVQGVHIISLSKWLEKWLWKEGKSGVRS